MESPIRAMHVRGDYEMYFKRTFAIQFLASLDAVNYASNVQSGWYPRRVREVSGG